jgi:hypothetical protein
MLSPDAKLEVVLTAKNLAKKGFDDFENQVKRTTREVNGSFTKMSNTIKTVVGGIALGSIATAWVREINAAGNAYFQMSQTFQDRTGIMVDAARQMAEDFNQFYNFNEIAYAFTKTADSMERYGITGQRYLDLVGRAAEVGAAKNLELKESIDRIESAIRGEAEASEYLGLTLNDTYMKNQAFNGALKDTWEKLTDNEKALHRYNELMNQSAKYAGSTEAAVNTLGGAWNRLINTLLDRGLDAMMQQNSILARGLNIVTDFVEALGKYNDRVAETIDRVERGLEKTGVRRFKMPPPPDGWGGYSNAEPEMPVMPEVVVTATGGGAGGGASTKKPDGFSNSQLAYMQYQGARVAPDWFTGMPEAGERAQAILDEVTETARVSFDDISVAELTWVDGALAGLAEYQAAASDTFQGASDFFGQSMNTMEDFLVDFVTTGKLEFKDLIDSILEDLARLMIRQNITGPLANLMAGGIFGASGGTGGSPFHVGMSGGSTTAFGFADGGIASGPTSGYPATLHGTEAIVPLSGGRSIPVEVKGGGDVQVIVNNNSGQQASVSETQTGDGMRQILVTIGNDIRRMGPVGQAIGGRFGLTAKGMA